MAHTVTKSDPAETEMDAQRLDKWLWFARVVKTRTLAATLVSGGKVRVNRTRITKPAQLVRADDVVTVSVPRGVRVLKIVACGNRRGPASEAASLFEEIVPISSGAVSSRVAAHGSSSGSAPTDAAEGGSNSISPASGQPAIEPGSGRPTKRDRRILDRLRSRDGD